MNKKLIFIHGYNASAIQKGWHPKIATMLSLARLDYSIPDLPGGEYPQSKEWIEIINREVRSSKKPVVLVGHSLGTRAVLLYLDKLEQRVDTVVLVAAFNNEIEETRKREQGKCANFFDYHLDLQKIKGLANKFIVIHSKDDDQIDYQQGVDISNALGAELITHEDKGHFTEPENARYVLKDIKQFLS